MNRVVVVGGGFAGCSASVIAKKVGGNVTLIERTNMLGGLGNVGGIMRNNGRYTAQEEAMAMGLGDLFKITDCNALHMNVNFPGHCHALFYDTSKIDYLLSEYLEEQNINIKLNTRISKINMDNNKIVSIETACGEVIEGDVFIDTTGTTGSMGNCREYGNGCGMCILRCPTFGPRVGLTELAGKKVIKTIRENGKTGAFSGSVKLKMSTLHHSIINKLYKSGLYITPLSDEFRDGGKLGDKVCKQYALREFEENLILIDTGSAKLMTPYIALEKLRTLEGFERVQFEDPYGGENRNSIRFLGSSIRDNTMKVCDVENLYCGGEKSGFFIGHTEAICTGGLAGFNAVRYLAGIEGYTLTCETAIGDLIAYSLQETIVNSNLEKRLTFAGGEYFQRMKSKGLYTTCTKKTYNKIEDLGLTDFFSKRIF